jgi:RHS repeat-associated protein
VQQIGTVRLWNRTDCCSDELSNFYVLVSDNPFSSTDLTTTINQAGVSNYYTAGQAGLLTQIGVGRSGRYVRVQLAGDNYLSLAEVEVMAGTGPVPGVKWLVQDHLGSTRMVVDYTGSLAGIKRHDFAPFGEELVAGPGIRSGSNGYSGDAVRQKFGSKERDIETGLDYFIARYHSPVQGRFTSVDPENAGSDPEDPQSWNGYAYTRNNPVLYSDPDGRKYLVCGPNGGGSCGFVDDRDFDRDRASIESQGLVFIGGSDFRSQGSIFFNGELQATYQRTSFDDLSDLSNGLIFGREGLGARAQGMQGLIGYALTPYAGGAIVATGGAALGVGGIGFGTTVTTLGLSVGTGTATGAATGAAVSIGTANKLIHIFGKAAHNLGPLVASYGSEAAAYSALETAVIKAVTSQGITGVYQIVVTVGGLNVTVRGAVVNGVVKIGTAFR